MRPLCKDCKFFKVPDGRAGVCTNPNAFNGDYHALAGTEGIRYAADCRCPTYADRWFWQKRVDIAPCGLDGKLFEPKTPPQQGNE